MLRPEVAQRIEALLRSGELSQRQIATQTGVHRGTVRLIAAGTWGQGLDRLPEVQGDATAQQPPLTAVPPEQSPIPKPARCRGCGALVFMPCMACRVRAYQRKKLASQKDQPGKRPAA